MPTRPRTAAQRRRAPADQSNGGEGSTAVAVIKPKEAIAQIDALMVDKREQLLSLFAGDAAMADRMRSLTLHALSNPKLMEKLQQADLASVIEAIRECASLGLMPIPSLAEGYFVPYWNSDKRKYDIQFQPGYQGLAKLVMNSGRVLDVDAGVAYANDLFEYEEGSNPFVRHVRALDHRGERIAAYAVARLPGGIVKVRVLPMADVEKHRKASKAAGSGPWVEWYDAMACKTAFKELQKFLPKSAVVERALLLDADIEDRYGPAPAFRVQASSEARDRVRGRLGAGPNANGGEERGATETAGDSEGTDTSSGGSDGSPAVLDGQTDEKAATKPEPLDIVDDRSPEQKVADGDQDAEEGEFRADPTVCGATSDPELGDVEVCGLAKGHTGPHKSKGDTRWPNR